MKKVGSLLLIAALVFSMGVGAFAAEDPTAFNGGTAFVDNAVGEGGVVRFDAANEDTGNDFIIMDETGGDNTANISPSFIWSGSGTDEITFAPGEILLVYDGAIVLPEERLLPNTEYEFEVYYNKSDSDTSIDLTGAYTLTPNLVPLTEDIISGATSPYTTGKLRLRTGKGNSTISKQEVTTSGSGARRPYKFKLTTKELYNTSLTDVTFTLLTSGTLPAAAASEHAPIQSTVSFSVGWSRVTEDEINSYAEGDTVTISNDAPVFLKKRIDQLVKNYNYKAVELSFEDGSWEYTGRMSGMGDTNFYTTQDVIPSLMTRFDQDFKFLIMPAGVTFPTNGEMRIDVSDVSGSWNRIYTYLYRNGRLTRINTTYDPVDDMIVFRTNYLGAFVMTDVEITDLTIVGPEEPITSEPPAPAPPTPPTNNNNPNTGIPMGLNLMMGLGAISLLTAGTAIIRKKK